MLRRRPAGGKNSQNHAPRPSQWRRAKWAHLLFCIGLAAFFVAHWRYVAPHLMDATLFVGLVVGGVLLYPTVQVLRRLEGNEPLWWDGLYLAALAVYFVGTLVDYPVLLIVAGVPVILVNLLLSAFIQGVEQGKGVHVYLKRDRFFYHYVYLTDSDSEIGAAGAP
jgi:hypothetical protein